MLLQLEAGRITRSDGIEVERRVRRRNQFSDGFIGHPNGGCERAYIDALVGLQRDT